MVLLVLAAIWAGVLLPPYLQRRRATHPSSSVVDFSRQLAVLQRTGRALHGAELHAGYATPARAEPPAPAYPAPAYAGSGYPGALYPGALYAGAGRMSRHEALRRRRDVFTTLAGAAVLTFVLALLLGGSVWLVQLLVDAALLGYVALLMQIQQQRRPVRAGDNVRYMPRAQSATQQALLRRSAN